MSGALLCISALTPTLTSVYLSGPAVPYIPFFGNGDCFSSQQYYESLETGVDGIMIARGALIKPWIFTCVTSRPLASSPLSVLTCKYSRMATVRSRSDANGTSRPSSDST